MYLIYGFSCVGVIFIISSMAGLLYQLESLEVLEYNFASKTESFSIVFVRMHLGVSIIISQNVMR